jgi:lysyl-tRNA synthetase class 2
MSIRIRCLSVHTTTFTKNFDTAIVALVDIEVIKLRSKLKNSLRRWFDENGYLEVSTPLLSPSLIPESSISIFSTIYSSYLYGERELYLVPSPELHMKRIIHKTHQSIYQISKCFRNDEQSGSHHNPEFTMLEYYTVGADEIDSIEITQRLFGQTKLPNTPDHLLPPFKKMSMAEVCYLVGGFDLEKVQNIRDLKEVAKNKGLTLPEKPESWDDTFNRLFLNFVEPFLPQDKPLVIYDYPRQIECLAKDKPNSFYKKRWELYAGGVELANCYDEEDDYTKIADFFRKQATLIALKEGLPIADVDYEMLDIFDGTFPQCSGVALGFDRLLMLQGRFTRVGDLILFNLSDTLKRI